MCERERVCVKTKGIEDWSAFAGSLWLSIREVMHVPYTWLECEESRQMETAVFRECLAGKAFPRDTCKTFYFTRLSFLIHNFCAYTIYTHITHRCWWVLLRENPSHKSWKLEIVIPTYLYTIACEFSSTPTSPFPYYWEVDSPNTYHTLHYNKMYFSDEKICH